jgi:hypothetical protein
VRLSVRGSSGCFSSSPTVSVWPLPDSHCRLVFCLWVWPSLRFVGSRLFLLLVLSLVVSRCFWLAVAGLSSSSGFLFVVVVSSFRLSLRFSRVFCFSRVSRFLACPSSLPRALAFLSVRPSLLSSSWPVAMDGPPTPAVSGRKAKRLGTTASALRGGRHSVPSSQTGRVNKQSSSANASLPFERVQLTAEQKEKLRSEVEAYFDDVRYKLACPNCSTVGKINRGAANGQRRFQCTCKRSWGNFAFLKTFNAPLLDSIVKGAPPKAPEDNRQSENATETESLPHEAQDTFSSSNNLDTLSEYIDSDAGERSPRHTHLLPATPTPATRRPPVAAHSTQQPQSRVETRQATERTRPAPAQRAHNAQPPGGISNNERRRQRALQTIRPPRRLEASELCLVWAILKNVPEAVLLGAMRVLQFRIDKIHHVYKAGDVTEMVIERSYRQAFIDRAAKHDITVLSFQQRCPRTYADHFVWISHLQWKGEFCPNPAVREFYNGLSRQMMDPDLTQHSGPALIKAHYNKFGDLLYVNVRGLTNDKFRALLACLKCNTLLFVAETWLIDEHERTTHPNVVASSISLPRMQNGRGKGGITLLASIDLTHSITVVGRTHHSLSVHICRSSSVTAIYYPGSLTPEQFQTELNALPVGTDVLLGDFNIRRGKTSWLGNPEKPEILGGYVLQNGLEWIRPHTSVDCSNIDHVFANRRMQIERLAITSPPVDTDHPMICLSLGESVIEQKTKPDSTKRYWSSRLSKESNLTQFRTTVRELVRSKLSTVSEIELNTVTSMHIDALDEVLLAILQGALEHTVGSYYPTASKPQTKRLEVDTSSISELTRAIRTAQRESAQAIEIVAENPRITALEEGKAYFEQLYSSEQSSIIQTNNVSAETDYARTSNNPDAMVVEHHIDTSMVVSAICAYPEGKSPGIDGIDRRVLKALTEEQEFIYHLCTLYQWCCAHGYCPRRWNNSLIVPIPKAGKDPKFVRNRRPVALTAIFRRIFEKLILEPVRSYLMFNRGQGGFRHGFSCLSHILLTEQARHLRMSHRVFLDLESAYDRVQIGLLLNKLQNRGVPRQLCALVDTLFTECTSQVVINGKLSEQFRRTRGLFQGSLLSPTLFNAYIDELATRLNATAAGQVPACLMFADDILLQSNKPNHIREMLGTVSEWCTQNGMKINVSKCGTFSRKANFSINREPVPVVDTYKYLGIPLCRKGIQIKDLLESNFKKAEGAFEKLRDSLSGTTWPPIAKINIYKMYIRSILDYGTPLAFFLNANKRCYKRQLKKLEKLQHRCLKWALGSKTTGPILNSLTGVPSIQNRQHELALKFKLHLHTLDDQNPLREWYTAERTCPLIKSATTRSENDPWEAKEIKRFIRTKGAREDKAKSNLCAYINQSCRLKRNGMDSCLEILKPKIRKAAIQWRTNSVGHRSLCLHCGMPFNRRHTNECMTFNIDDRTLSKFQTAKSEISMECFNLLDFLLNIRRYRIFYKCYKTLLAQTGHIHPHG